MLSGYSHCPKTVCFGRVMLYTHEKHKKVHWPDSHVFIKQILKGKGSSCQVITLIHWKNHGTMYEFDNGEQKGKGENLFSFSI